MVTVRTRPDVYGENIIKTDAVVRSAKVGFGGMLAVTKKGPVQGVIVRSRSYNDWARVWGGRDTVARGDAAYEAKSFFDEGGFELLTTRACHYTDVDDKTSFTGVVASNTAITDGVGATAATKITSVSPFNLEPAATFSMDVDSGGVAASLFSATPATIVDTTSYAVADQTGLTLTVVVNLVGTLVTFGTATTAQQIVDDINAQVQGVSAIVSGGQVLLTTDLRGTGATITITAGTSALTWAASTASTGNVANIDAVTGAEFETIVEAATNAEVTVNSDLTCTISSPTTGAASELIFSGADLADFGLTAETINGTAAGATYSTATLEAGYHGVASPGLDGNNLSRKWIQNPLHPSSGAGSDLAVDASGADTALQMVSLQGLNVNSVIRITDGTNTEYHQISGVRTVVTAGVVTFFVDLSIALTNAFTAAAALIQSQEFDLEVYENDVLVEATFSGMSSLAAADNYFVTLLNDEDIGSEYVVATALTPVPPGLGADIPATDTATVAFAGGTDETTGLVDADWIGSSIGGTGIYGFDTTREFMAFCTPGNNNASVFNAAVTYAESKLYFEYIGYVSAGITATAAVAYRNNVIGVNSSYGALYVGGIKVFDPSGVGKNPKRSLSGMGYMMGLRARVDQIAEPNGGPWEAPAGYGEHGESRYALDVVTEYNDTDQGLLNDAHVNCIIKGGPTEKVRSNGSRTLDATTAQRFMYINTRRFFNFAMKSIVDSTRWAVHRNNDSDLWNQIRNNIDSWLLAQMPLGAYPTNTKELAFYVKVGIDDGVMTSADRDLGYLISEVGIAPIKPAEFIIIRLSQFDSGFDIEVV